MKQPLPHTRWKVKRRKLNRSILISLAAMGLTALILTATSCSALWAQQHVLIPTLRQAWRHIVVDVDAGLQKLDDGAAAAVLRAKKRMDEALFTGEAAAILLVNWKILAQAAEIGIAARVASGLIGPDVAESLRERLRQFGAALAAISARL